MTAKTDREFLELAAKAAGIELTWVEPGEYYHEAWCFIPYAKPPHNKRKYDKERGDIWDPLSDDGDALRLAVKLGIVINIDPDLGGETEAWHYGRPGVVFCEFHDDAEAATRRAIVRAAAAIGEAKP